MPDPSTGPSARTHPARNADLLGVYCNDHLAAASGGIELVERMIGAHAGTVYQHRLHQLRTELLEERAGLERVLAALDLPVRPYKQALVWVGEKLARAKLNGRLLTRSPLSSLVEFEFLTAAVLAKRAGFESLLGLAEVDPRIDRELLLGLVRQADRQHRWLAGTRREVAAEVFGGRAESADDASAS